MGNAEISDLDSFMKFYNEDLDRHPNRVNSSKNKNNAALHGVSVETLFSNKGTSAFGFDFTKSALYQSLQNLAACALAKGLPIVSIGSGQGGLEAWMEHEFHIQMICIDPDPAKWLRASNTSAHAPDFKNVDDLLKVVLTLLTSVFFCLIGYTLIAMKTRIVMMCKRF